MRKVIGLVMLLIVAMATTATASSYNYVNPAQFKQWLESGKKMQTVDIQLPAEFQKHHFKDAIQTNAFPVKTAEEKQKLEKIVPSLAAGGEDIVVVCPRGGGGAKNTYDYLKERGIDEKRMYILKDGMQGWPYQELAVAGSR
jgi:rhodanese-related sulfurtransferase